MQPQASEGGRPSEPDDGTRVTLAELIDIRHRVREVPLFSTPNRRSPLVGLHHSKLRVKDGNDGILIGVSSVEQLENNLDNLEKGPLPADVVEALDQAWAVSKADSANYWHGDVEYGYNTHEALFAGGAK